MADSSIRRGHAKVLAEAILDAARRGDSVIRPVMEVMELWSVADSEPPLEEAFFILAETLLYYEVIVSEMKRRDHGRTGDTE